jgi:hypothetical protein
MMQDPMANLTGETPAGQNPSNMNGGNTKEVFDPIALQLNMQRIGRIQSVMGIAAGCVAGIAGMTGFEGLGEYSTKCAWRTKNCVRNACRGPSSHIVGTASNFFLIIPSWSTVCFISLHLFVCITIWAWKMNFDLDGYTKKTWVKYLSTDIQPTGLSFTLFWTLFYGLVYLY